MEWIIACLLCEVVFTRHFAYSVEFSPPWHVKVKSSVLTWCPPNDENNVTYAVQYNTTLNDWCNVFSGTQQNFDFTSDAEYFYGKRFRVRAERGNQTSAWVMSKLVQCAHLHTCAPILELKVERDKVHLWMKHRDQSVTEEEGKHIMFRPLYWKRNDTDNEQLHEPIVNSDHLILKDLEPRQEYCFQVEYLLFHQPHGQPSHVICEVIPETSKQRNLRVIMIGVLSVAGFASLGMFLYFVFIYYKRIKGMLRPPLDIPDHIEEFLFHDFTPSPVIPPSSQENESFEFVILLEEEAEAENRHDLDNEEENSSST